MNILIELFYLLVGFCSWVLFFLGGEEEIWKDSEVIEHLNLKRYLQEPTPTPPTEPTASTTRKKQFWHLTHFYHFSLFLVHLPGTWQKQRCNKQILSCYLHHGLKPMSKQLESQQPNISVCFTKPSTPIPQIVFAGLYSTWNQTRLLPRNTRFGSQYMQPQFQFQILKQEVFSISLRLGLYLPSSMYISGYSPLQWIFRLKCIRCWTELVGSRKVLTQLLEQTSSVLLPIVPLPLFPAEAAPTAESKSEVVQASPSGFWVLLREVQLVLFKQVRSPKCCDAAAAPR